MKIIEPKNFADSFLKIYSEKHSTIFPIWKDDTLTKFTSAMRSLIFPFIAEELGLNIYNADYFTFDAIFYEKKDCINFSDHTTFAECILVALEHENNIRGTATEMNKLQIINSPLKVLISYPNRNAQQYLDIYSKIISAADIFSDFSTKRKQLVIFGYCEDDIKIKWEFYIYKEGSFSKICERVFF